MTTSCPAPTAVTLTNLRSREVIARDVEVVSTFGRRSRSTRTHGSAIVLAPCFVAHTAFMRFAIDVVFVGRGGEVQQIIRRLRPWRIAASRGAYATIEFAAGALDSCDVAIGDRLCLGVAMSLRLSQQA
jgi:hypothetical protein